MSYSVADFGHMIADRVRMSAYEEALRRVVKPGSVVVDVGTGTGIFALWACKLGAKHVYAIDPNPSIEVAKENAKRNGFADRITFFRALSTEVELPEKADVLVSDMRGSYPVYAKHLVNIADARTRFLKDGGMQLPAGDELMVAPVSIPEGYADLFSGSANQEFDLSACQESIADTEQLMPKGAWTEKALVAAPAVWAAVDYTTVREADVQGRAAFTVLRTATAHGLALWFRATVLPGIHYDNGPSSREQVYKPLFLPWPKATPLEAGDMLEVELTATSAGDYFWGWTTRVRGAVLYKQNSFHATGPTMALLRRASPAYAPGLSPKGSAVRLALEAFATGQSQGAVAERLRTAFPELFREPGSALGLAQRLGREFGAREV